MRNSVLIFMFAIFLSMSVSARRQTLKVDERAIKTQQSLLKQPEVSVECDSATILSGIEAESSVKFFGYDKPHDARQESLFVSNNLLNDTIRQITFRMYYFTTKGDPLHTREVTEEVEIAPGQTLRLQIATWDKTNTFYHFRTPPARKSGLTPYRVKMKALQVRVK